MHKTKMLRVRLSPDEWEQLEREAEANLLSKSELVRCKTLHNKIPKKITAVAMGTYRELGRIGNNINQLARAANIAINRGQIPPDATDELMELKRLLLEVRAEILDLDTYKTLEDDRQAS